MDQQIDRREHRFNLAERQRDTTRQWDLVAAAVEAAIVEYLQIKKDDVKQIRGRSKVRFLEQKRDALSLEQVEDKAMAMIMQRLSG